MWIAQHGVTIYFWMVGQISLAETRVLKVRLRPLLALTWLLQRRHRSLLVARHVQFAIWLEHAWTLCLHRIRRTLPGRREDWALYRHSRGGVESVESCQDIAWIAQTDNLDQSSRCLAKPWSLGKNMQELFLGLARAHTHEWLLALVWQSRRCSSDSINTSEDIYQSNSRHVQGACNSSIFGFWISGSTLEQGLWTTTTEGRQVFSKSRIHDKAKKQQKTWFT